MLFKTGNKKLVEDSTWKDTYWRMCNGKCKNQLQKTLMRIGEELNEQ